MAQPPKKSNRIQGLANYSKTEHGEFEEFIDKYEAEAIKDGITTYRAQRELLPTYAPCMKDLLLLHKAKLDPATDWAGFKQAWIQATKPPQYLQNHSLQCQRRRRC